MEPRGCHHIRSDCTAAPSLLPSTPPPSFSASSPSSSSVSASPASSSSSSSSSSCHGMRKDSDQESSSLRASHHDRDLKGLDNKVIAPLTPLTAVFRNLDQLKSLLSALCLEVSFELTSVQSARVDAISSHFQQSLSQLSQIQSLIAEHLKSISTTSFDTPLDSSEGRRSSHPPRTPVGSDASPSTLSSSESPLLCTTTTTTTTPDQRNRSSVETRRMRSYCDSSGTSWEDDLGHNRINRLECQNRERRLEQQVAATTTRENPIVIPHGWSSGQGKAASAVRLPGEERVKKSWSEAMQEGSWFFRVTRKFGALGKALKTLHRKRVYLYLSQDFGNLFISKSEPRNDHLDKSHTVDGRKSTNQPGSQKPTKLALDSVDSFEYGYPSHAFRLLEETHCENEHPAFLCLSIRSAKVTLDLIALNDDDVENWVLGLNCLVPFVPGRQFFTAAEFSQTKNALKDDFFRNLDKPVASLASSPSRQAKRGESSML